MEIFWNTIAQYNEATWWTQLLITAAGILLTTQLYRKPTLWAKRSMKIYMVFLNGWISIVYYMMYCGARGHHHILAIFWGVIAVLAMGFVYRLHSVRAQPEIQGTGGGTLCNAFPLPAPFVGTRNGISHDDHHRDALLGSSFHHRAAAGFLAQGQPARHSVPLPLGAHRLFQSLHLQDSRRPATGKRHCACHLSVLQELL